MMKKLLLPSVPLFFMLLLLCCYTISNAQDSVKAPSLKPAAKPVIARPTTVKYPVKPGTAQGYPVKTGTAQGYPVKTGATQGYPAKTYPAKPAAAAPAPAAATGTTQPPASYTVTPVSTDKSLAGQYQYVLTKVYHYQQPMIAALWHNVNDTLKLTIQQLKAANAKLATQNQTISSLQNDVKTRDQTIDDASNKGDEISLLGIPFSKTAYSLMMWGLVIGLGVILLIVVLRTTGNSREAKYRTQLYDELNEEYLAYKAKANDKEKKLARELQTERNKVDELMGRG